MTKRGWRSRDKLSDVGWGINKNKSRIYGYSIWFERYEWHGRDSWKITGSTVCFHRHTSNLDNIDKAVRECAEQALNAYEDYKDCIPYQTINNTTNKLCMNYDWNDKNIML